MDPSVYFAEDRVILRQDRLSLSGRSERNSRLLLELFRHRRLRNLSRLGITASTSFRILLELLQGATEIRGHAEDGALHRAEFPGGTWRHPFPDQASHGF